MNWRLPVDTRTNGEDSSPLSSAQFSVVAASVIAAILVIVIATYVREPSEPVPVSEIRIRNDSQVDFQDVVVGRGRYGDLGKGQTSSYLTWGPAYRYAYVALRAGEKVFRVVPEDYVGEVPLGAGQFTFALTISDPASEFGIDIAIERD